MDRTSVKVSVRDGTMTSTRLSGSVKHRRTCRSCAAGPLSPVLTLGDQFLVNFVPEMSPDLPRAPLDLMRCSDCGLLQLGHTVNPETLFREFWYRSAMNETMRTALNDVVKTGLHYHHDGVWLDIGANDGYLLSQVPPGFRKIACEPALNFANELADIADNVVSDFFSAKHECLYAPSGTGFKTIGACDVITSAAMFYDLDDPNSFVADIASVLSPNGIWINQLNDAPTMLKANAFDSICHEHLCYYDVHALEVLYRRHGLVVIGVTYNDVNGGSIRVVAEKPSSLSRHILPAEHKRATENDARLFAVRVEKWKERMTELLTGSMIERGPLWLYGASTKGSVLLQYLDLDGAFKAIADRNPAKHGLMMAGTWLPIVSEDEMRAEKPKYLLVLPWAFKREFIERERELLDGGTTMLFPLPSIEFIV